ncbi:MAG: hypothetical protein H6850_03165 [Alphaproteobacteria bacterium]|nr:MAG: hypothetical protein H6850_03165 [Alphaproteobacteria bacterium]
MSKLNYDKIVQDALRGVIVQVLRHIEDHGMKKNEYIRLTFMPELKGVTCPAKLAKEYSNGLCIELQEDKYENLQVGHDRFSLDLYVGEKIEHFVIPFRTISHIVDPNEQFGLEFDVSLDKIDNLPDNVVCLESFRKSKH